MLERPREARWLLLIQQIPKEPPYLRVKIWRRLQQLGAVPIKNAVYALPRSEERNEDLQWVIREITAGGGEATLVEAAFVQGMSDAEVEALFNRARDADYAELADDVRAAARRIGRRRRLPGEERQERGAELRRLTRRFDEISTIDFFSSSGREATRALIDDLGKRLATGRERRAAPRSPQPYRGRTWVTRQNLFVDRIASAWLIRRFIDPDARFKFVVGKGYRPEPGELRFDMFEAEFTHEGDRCSFEVMLERFGLRDAALGAIAELVHDIDLKDAKYEREETTGLAHLVLGLCMSERDDETRIARGGQLFDYFYDYFRRKRT